ncbi:16S rRNA (uracil(1498)-N(3))-methyltransferase [Dehalococcoidia bacterium]|nr:16S rRNA (uracil(1498)-N(3))-methyltransferase [Dehalococcoidia bacterium]
MHRFFVPSECIQGNRIVISGRQAHRLREVLRLEVGVRIVVLDGSGLEYLVELLDITSGRVTTEVVKCYHCSNEPRIQITLYQALLKGSGFDLVLQKCTEIGVVEFVPMICERCIADSPSPSRISRWEKIITEAAEQSGRGIIPRLNGVVHFEGACQEVDGFSLLPWEGEEDMGIRAALQAGSSVNGTANLNVFIGAEGGFSAREVELARSKGLLPITLGKRILRAETAGMAAVAVILYEYGELGG